jgi:spore germination protein YaaH
MKSREEFHKYNKINVTWDYISTYDVTPDLSKEKKINGLDVISPTWFNLTQNGIVINNGDLKYVHDAHEKGYEIWALFKNNFDPDLTTEMLNNPLLREKVIAQLVFYLAYYELDGLNIDFENVYLKDKQLLVTFIKELDFYIEKQNIVLSIDVTVPWGSDMWSKFLDRKSIAKYVDYVMLMAYDEHWASSPVSGSVDSIGWVERGISESLKLIPKEKLLLGIPFYTRVWTEKNTSGKKTVSSKSMGMQYVDSFLSDKNEDLTWDEEAGQFLAQYKSDGNIYKIWIEDETSMELKLELVNKYDIAGVASWRKGFENEEIWELIYETIKK